MAILQVNHTTIQSSAPNYMGDGGTYVAKPPAVLRQTGLGTDIVAGYATVDWSWPYLSTSDISFWYTILLGQASQLFSHAYLYNHVGQLVTYSSAVIHMITFARVQGDVFHECKISLTNLL